MGTGPKGISLCLGLCLGLCVVCTSPHITMNPIFIGLGLGLGHCQCEDTTRVVLGCSSLTVDVSAPIYLGNPEWDAGQVTLC